MCNQFYLCKSVAVTPELSAVSSVGVTIIAHYCGPELVCQND
jgi:hypothetical protein